MVARLACLSVGYLCGSMLTAEVVTRRVAGRSVFEMGDGNPGMANVGHELGTPAALACLVGDILKTLVPVLVMSRMLPQLGWQASTAWTGLGATVGHIYPFWHDLRGGKGVATIASTVVLMKPALGVLAGVVGVVTIICSGYLSVAAVAAICAYAVAAPFVLPWDCAAVSIAFVVLTCVAHGSKLRGIRTGTTRRASLSTKFWAKMRGR